MPPRELRSRNWVFTLNNPNEPYGTLICEQSTYLKYQLERGEVAGTVHYQGFVLFKQKKSLRQVKIWFPGAHLEMMRGSVTQNEFYCGKEDTRIDGPWDFGEAPVGAGARTDILACKSMIDDGKTDKEVADSYFGTWARGYRAFGVYRRLTMPHRAWSTYAIVYWGPPGSGKSRHAYELGGDSQFWVNRPNSRNGSLWWCGYAGEETVVIDEFYGWISRDIMQRIVDRYPLTLETKGGSVEFIARRVIITSNSPPDMWWKIGLGALERRLEFVYFVGNPGQSEAEYRETLQPAVVPGFIIPRDNGVIPAGGYGDPMGNRGRGGGGRRGPPAQEGDAQRDAVPDGVAAPPPFL